MHTVHCTVKNQDSVRILGNQKMATVNLTVSNQFTSKVSFELAFWQNRKQCNFKFYCSIVLFFAPVSPFLAFPL